MDQQINYGTRDHKRPANSEITEYKLSPEELEKYRNGGHETMPSTKESAKEGLQKAKQIIDEAIENNQAVDLMKIADKTGANRGTIKTYYYQQRSKQQQEYYSEKKEEADTTDSNEQLQNQYKALEANMKNTSQCLADAEAELEDLRKQNGELKIENADLVREKDNLKTFSKHIEQENQTLLSDNDQLKRTVHILSRNEDESERWMI
ncbi:hypothetical protein [Tuberibacillus sp. Marseille-P3662]|uniref:hypothetical protein n=1 Tax=Tuberibacillus sp. Marseille-P3662 TaxID=1965358 RepID=UPI000A1C846E|nr:hypothetical protein [Tuberibacillus sp. Marseille-P3662]